MDTTSVTKWAVADVLEAWRNAGPRPDIHAQAKGRLLNEWPTLYRALVKLDRETSR